MHDSHLQITVRGLDPQTKSSLVKKAKQQGMSLNKYALRTLQKSAGLNDSNNRYQALKQFLDIHHIDKNDKKAIDEALAWSDSVSIEKQQQEQI